MKNYKGNMLLIELTIVILFFSISQLAVARIFAAADQKARQSDLLSVALLSAEDTAEGLACQEDPEAALRRWGFAEENGQYVRSDERGFDLLVSVEKQAWTAGKLLQIEIVAREEGRELFRLPVDRYLPREEQP